MELQLCSTTPVCCGAMEWAHAFVHTFTFFFLTKWLSKGAREILLLGGARFSSQHPHGGLQLSVTPGNSMSSDIEGTMHTGKTLHTHKKSASHWARQALRTTPRLIHLQQLSLARAIPDLTLIVYTRVPWPWAKHAQICLFWVVLKLWW